jgi:flagellar motor switch protein FliN/FliY
MGDMLSQAELDALLGNMMDEDDANSGGGFAGISEMERSEILSLEDQDVLGEIGNINMGTAATTLSSLLQNRVQITTPKVHIIDWQTLSGGYDRPAVGVRVAYSEGLQGSNVLILKDRDVKIIADLMMGGAGTTTEPVELNDLDMSAIGEAMNQMVGSAATSLSSMVNKKIDIAPPQPFKLDFSKDESLDAVDFASDELIVSIAFRMEVGNLIDSEIMQILPVGFAKEMVINLKEHMMGGNDVQEPVSPPPAPAPSPSMMAAAPVHQAPPVVPVPQHYAPQPQQPQVIGYNMPPQNVQTVQMQPLDYGEVYQQKENMGIIMDVPLEITVELGRTHKKISEILEFSPGTVLVLDKLAGEPIDILVNGKFVAKGEVVVIDENFGIRITEIVSVEKRI